MVYEHGTFDDINGTEIDYSIFNYMLRFPLENGLWSHSFQGDNLFDGEYQHDYFKRSPKAASQFYWMH